MTAEDTLAISRFRLAPSLTNTCMTPDDTSRRAYWAEQMEAGYAIVQKLITFPVNECGERFASIPDAAADAGVEMLFSTCMIALDREPQESRAT